MVDVSGKPSTVRRSIAEAIVQLGEDTYQALMDKRIGKGDVLTTAELAGIMGAKNTFGFIPLCHSVVLDAVNLSFTFDEEAYALKIQAEVSSCGRTGVEMEALTAVSVASLTVYDMCKSISKAIRITDIRLIFKEGGVRGPLINP